MMKKFKFNVVLWIVVSAAFTGCGSNSKTTQGTAGNNNTALVLALSSTSISPGSSLAVSALGGTAPYSYSLISGIGTLANGIYTAPTAIGSALLQVTDSTGAISASTITITDSITLNSSLTSVATSGTVTLTAASGLAPYTFTILSGGGTINTLTSSGVSTFTAPQYASTTVIQVTDANASTATLSLSITSVGSIQVTPSSITLYQGDIFTFTAKGGSGSYSYALISGGGSMSGAVYTAPSSTTTTATVQVWDTSTGHTATAQVTVVKPNPLYSVAALITEANGLLTYNLPTSTNYLPSFVIGGSDSSGNFGYNVNSSTSTNSFGAAPASAALVLTNFNWNDSYPYTGLLVVSGRGGSNQFNFCVQAGDHVAHLSFSGSQNFNTAVSSLAARYASFASQASAGTNIQGVSVINLDGTSTGAGNASISIQNAQHNHYLTNCSAYTSYTLVSSSTN